MERIDKIVQIIPTQLEDSWELTWVNKDDEPQTKRVHFFALVNSYYKEEDADEKFEEFQELIPMIQTENGGFSLITEFPNKRMTRLTRN